MNDVMISSEIEKKKRNKNLKFKWWNWNCKPNQFQTSTEIISKIQSYRKSQRVCWWLSIWNAQIRVNGRFGCFGEYFQLKQNKNKPKFGIEMIRKCNRCSYHIVNEKIFAKCRWTLLQSRCLVSVELFHPDIVHAQKTLHMTWANM